jgi:predicted transposase YdaD
MNQDVDEIKDELSMRSNIMEESTVYRSIRQEVQEKRSREIAHKVLQEGVSIEVVALCTDLSIEEVQQIQSQMNQPSPG